jgi:iron(III) transport system substrate-binding protein
MIPHRFASAPALLPALLLIAISSGCGRDEPAGRAEVVVYCSADQAAAEPILKAFEESTGIRVLARYDTEAGKTVGLVQRLRAERARPIADVFWSSEVFHTIHLADEQLLAGGLNVPQGWPAQFVGDGGRWIGFASRGRVIAYNTGRVPAEQSPRTLEDLLAPRWRGRIAMASPVAGTTSGDVASWFAHYGQARAEAILAGLKANEVRLVDGNSVAVRMVATGRADVCMTDTDDVHAAQRNGWPVAMHPLDQAGRGALTIPNTVAIVAGAPHPDQAGRLVEFLLSAEVERMLAAGDSHNAPVSPAVAGEFPQFAMPNSLPVDYRKVAQFLPQAREALR